MLVISFEFRFLKVDNIMGEFIYENLEMLVGDRVTVFHSIIASILHLDKFWIWNLLRFVLYENSMSDSDEQLIDHSLSNVAVGLVSFLQSRILFFAFLPFGFS